MGSTTVVLKACSLKQRVRSWRTVNSAIGFRAFLGPSACMALVPFRNFFALMLRLPHRDARKFRSECIAIAAPPSPSGTRNRLGACTVESQRRLEAHAPRCGSGPRQNIYETHDGLWVVVGCCRFFSNSCVSRFLAWRDFRLVCGWTWTCLAWPRGAVRQVWSGGRGAITGWWQRARCSASASSSCCEGESKTVHRLFQFPCFLSTRRGTAPS